MRKNILALLTALAIVLSCAAGLAEAVPQGLPAIGEKIHGFTVTDCYTLDNLDATCVYMIHDKTKARLTYIANEDTDRAFDITFRTPADNDKGIPHVFEHATLCGSVKYPDPSLFFNMMFQTYNTFLNAMTMQGCTTFPAASLSEDQLYVFADYILSGVFNPTIMTDERAMMREAYRYELESADSEITLNGTVYSEMQGSMMITGMAGYNMRKLLYPGSIYANVAGGDPAVIAEMTHQELKDFHDGYYHPSNSMIVLYGKLDYDKFLKLIDEEYLSAYDYRDITLDDSAYEPFEGFRESVSTFPVAKDSGSQPIAIYGITMKDATIEDSVLFPIITSALSKESSTFMKLCREKLPNSTVAMAFDDTTTEPTLMIMGLNIGEDEKDTLKNTVDEAFTQVMADGLDMGVIESLCRQAHYTDVLSKGQSGVGVNAAMSIGTEWGTTTDPFCYKAKRDVSDNLMSYVEKDAFNEAFRRNLSNPVSSALAVTVPEDGGMEKRSQQLQEKLGAMKAAMTEDEIDALVARTDDFNAWTQGNSENSMIDKVKVVSVETLPEEITRYEASERDINGMRAVTSVVELSDVMNIALNFNTSVIPFEKLQDYSIFTQLIMSMPTKNYTAEQIADALSDCSYSASVHNNTIEFKSGSYQPTLTASWLTTQDKLEESFALIEEILYNVDFSDCDLIRRVLRENVTNNKMMASIMPDYVMLGYGMPLIKDSGLYGENLTGDENMRYQQEISNMTDEEIASLAERMYAVRDMLLNQDGFDVTCVGGEESIEQFLAEAEKFYGNLNAEKPERFDYTGLFQRYEAPLACVLDGTVQFNMIIASMKDSGFEDNGKMTAMSQLVYDKILMQVLRFQNSAYGARSALDGDMVYVASYRDPNLAATYEVLESLGDRIRELKVTQDDLDGYITGAYSSLATPLGALAGGNQAVNDLISGETTFDDLQRHMAEIKQFTPDDVITYSAIYDMLAEKGAKVTVGGAEAIEQNRDLFKTVITTYIE